MLQNIIHSRTCLARIAAVAVFAGVYYAAAAQTAKPSYAPVPSGDQPCACPCPCPPKTLAAVASFDRQATGVAIAPDGRIFVAFPNWSDKHGVSVAQLAKDGTLKPFPDVAWNKWPGDKNNKGADPSRQFVSVQSVYYDNFNTDNALWILDSGNPQADGAAKGVVAGAPKLVKIDLATNKVSRVIGIDAAAPKDSLLSDVRLDNSGYAYITDAGLGAIVVVDLNTGRAFRFLENDASTKADPTVVPAINGRELRDRAGTVPKINVDGLAISPEKSWLYYKPLIGDTLYRIPTDTLRHAAQAKMGAGDMPDLAANVYPLPEKVGATGGMIMDQGGNLYLTAPEQNGVLLYSRDGKLILLIQDAVLLWPDSLSLGPTGEIYVTASQRRLDASFNGRQDKFQPPFKLFRIDGFKAMTASRADYGMSD